LSNNAAYISSRYHLRIKQVLHKITTVQTCPEGSLIKVSARCTQFATLLNEILFKAKFVADMPELALSSDGVKPTHLETEHTHECLSSKFHFRETWTQVLFSTFTKTLSNTLESTLYTSTSTFGC
jgi:hypothetical protein